MRIGLDARMARITGIGRYVVELSRALQVLGKSVTAFVAPKDLEWWQGNLLNIPAISTPEPIYSWSEQLVFPARMSRAEVDLVHFTNFNVPFKYRGPFVFTLHDLTLLSFRGERRTSSVAQVAYRRVLHSALARAAQIIVPSQQVRALLSNLTSPSVIAKTNVVPHAVPANFRKQKVTAGARSEILRKLGINKPFILYSGNFRSHKNVPTLIRAFTRFFMEEPNSQLVLAGPVTERQSTQLNLLFEQLKMRQEIVMTNEAGEETLLALYDSARALVMPSWIEGFGLPALEATARGLPVLASETTPVREFLGRGVLTFNPRDAEQLADLLATIWYDVAMRERLVTLASPALIRTWDDVARETCSIYQAACPEIYKR